LLTVLLCIQLLFIVDTISTEIA